MSDLCPPGTVIFVNVDNPDGTTDLVSVDVPHDYANDPTIPLEEKAKYDKLVNPTELTVPSDQLPMTPLEAVLSARQKELQSL
jgi:hypothetical protein